jgi:type IV secretory pathway protease TraF
VNGKVFLYPTKYSDSNHRLLKVFPRGIYRNIKGYFLIGSHNDKSWDSRYWGMLTKSMILFELKPAFMLKIRKRADG